jgi:NAD(P)-dependent dehydrogenase (short-subunit alcohol dehydrogenase family)
MCVQKNAKGPSETDYPCKSAADLARKELVGEGAGGGGGVVTDASSGAEFKCCERLAGLPGFPKVVLAFQNKERGKGAVESLNKAIGAVPAGLFQIVLLDTSEIASGHAVPKALAEAGIGPVDVLLLNAGGMGSRDTSDIIQRSGATRTFATNMVGHAKLCRACSLRVR